MLKNFAGEETKLFTYLEAIGYEKFTYMQDTELHTCFFTRLNDNEIMVLEEDFDTVAIFNVTVEEEEEFIRLFTGTMEEFDKAYEKRVPFDGRQDPSFALGLVKFVEDTEE